MDQDDVQQRLSEQIRDEAPEQERLREGAVEIVRTLGKKGHRAYFVGGCVRDELLGLPLKDIDIATDARPETIRELFPGSRFVGAKFGVALVRRNDLAYEVATFRKDGRYLDHRRPSFVTHGSFEEDARRRDFTINALFEDPLSGEIHDPTGGRADLERGVIRCVGDPEKRFNEDALRLLRAVRFASRFQFDIEPDTFEAMRELAHTIEYISPERQRDELTGILKTPQPSVGLRLMDRARLLRWLLPEIEAMKGIEQGKTWHPEGDVFQHTMQVMDHIEPRTTVNVWAALLHDVGKPPTYQRDETGHITFYDHQYVGAKMAEEIMTRLRFSRAERDAVASVVRRHMMFKDVTHMRPARLRRFISAPTIENDLAVHRADCLGSRGWLEKYHFVKEKKEELEQRREPAVPPPLITGHDLMELGMPQGPEIGRMLRAVQELQLEGELKSREEALEWVRRNSGFDNMRE